jgi:hypothetical protein
MIAEIISHTPTWVFVIFALVAWRGISAMRERTVQPGSLLLIALAFLVYGAVAAYSLAGDASLALLSWLAALAVGVTLGVLSVPRSAVFASASGIRQAGSVVPLLLILVIFASRYVVGALAAVHPEWLESFAARLLICSVYGLLSGIMVGRMLCIVQRARLLSASDRAMPVAQ